MNIDDIARECAEKIQEECITWPDEYYSDGAQDLIKSTLQQVADDAAMQMQEDCMSVCYNSKDAYKKRQIDATPKGHIPDLVLCGLYIQLVQTIEQLPLPSERRE